MSPEYCQFKLQLAEEKNHEMHIRFPYEYICWKVLLDDIEPVEQNLMDFAQSKSNPDWSSQTANLYHHPDFTTWFLEDGDEINVNESLAEALESVGSIDAETDSASWIKTMDEAADDLVYTLLSSKWQQVMANRLADTAFLLKDQKANTLSILAATESLHIANWDNDKKKPLEGFLKAYGRRCVEEFLLYI